jgi:hypothetical protein
VPKHVVDIRELLLEVALERFQAVDQLVAGRERPAEECAAPRPVAGTEVSVMHQFTSFPAS